MHDAIRIVRHRDLEPSWTVLRAKEPGFRRSLITWMGGPDGYINTNPGVAIESRHCAVGLMDMGPGQRQPGVHVHSMVEVYVILDGEAESFDGVGGTHRVGPLDCLHIPKGVPHGVRTIGERPVRLLWVNDAIERWGVSRYEEGPGPHPAEGGETVSAIRLADLRPGAPGLLDDGRGLPARCVSWVGGPGRGVAFDAAVAARNDRVAISLVDLAPGSRMPPTLLGERACLLVLAAGRAVVADGRIEIGALDALSCPADSPVDLRATGEEPTRIVVVAMAAESRGRPTGS